MGLYNGTAKPIKINQSRNWYQWQSLSLESKYNSPSRLYKRKHTFFHV